MPLNVLPTESQTIAQGGRVCFQASGTLDVPAVQQNVSWQQLHNLTVGTNSALTHTGATAGFQQTSALGSVCIVPGVGGFINFELDPIVGGGTGIRVGLTPDSSVSGTIGSLTVALPFSVEIDSPTTVRVVENGATVATQTVPVNAQVRITISGGGVSYQYFNGSTFPTFYTSSQSPSAPCYRAFCQLNNPSQSVSLMVEKSNGGTVSNFPPSWVSWSLNDPTIGAVTSNGLESCVDILPTAAPGPYTITLTAPDGQVITRTFNVTVGAGGLVFQPKDGASCFTTSQVVEFDANGGALASLTATGGTALSSIRWLSPPVAGTYTLTYTVGGVSIDYIAVVYPRISIDGVKAGYLRGLLPGQEVQLTGMGEGLTWASSTHPTSIQPNGLLVVPGSPLDSNFGASEIDVTSTDICGNKASFTVIVDPVFPSSNHCGPIHRKWKRSEAKFYGGKVELSGKTEYYLSHDQPSYQWDIEYKHIPLCPPTQDAGQRVKCAPATIAECAAEYPVADRLDRFWEFVRGIHKSFTVIDPKGTLWQGVHFISYESDFDKVNQQNRKLKMIWEPDCGFPPGTRFCVFDYETAFSVRTRIGESSQPITRGTGRTRVGRTVAPE